MLDKDIAAEAAVPVGLRDAWRASRGPTVLLTASVPIAALATLLLPAAAAGAVDAALGRSGVTTAVLRLAAVLVVGLAAGVVAALAGPVLQADVTAHVRHRLAKHVTALGTGGRNTFQGGDLTARLVGSASDAASFAPAVLGSGGALVTSLGAVVALGVIDPWLALAFAAALLPGVLAVRAFMGRATDLFERYQAVQSRIAARLTDALAGARTIRACGTHDRETERVLVPLPELSTAGYGLWRAQRRAATQVALLAPVVELAVLAAAGWALSEGQIPPGGLVAAAGYAALGLGILEQIESLVAVAHARAGRRRVAEVLATTAAPHGTSRVLPPGKGALTFRQVSLEAGGRQVLADVDLTVPAGTALALVGASGSGKSLLAALPGRLHDPAAGDVLLDGVPVNRLAQGELRRAVAYAFADPQLTGHDIRTALAQGRPGADAADVGRAAALAHADTFIARLPEGFATPLEHLALSGGERQRLGLARAVVQDARVLVLDDATSGLDTVTEHQVMSAFRRNLVGRTRLIVAHRAAAAAAADQVAWLDGGRVRAVGTHAELWEDPAYRAVFGAGGEAVTETCGDGVAARTPAEPEADDAPADPRPDDASGPTGPDSPDSALTQDAAEDEPLDGEGADTAPSRPEDEPFLHPVAEEDLPDDAPAPPPPGFSRVADTGAHTRLSSYLADALAHHSTTGYALREDSALTAYLASREAAHPAGSTTNHPRSDS